MFRIQNKYNTSNTLIVITSYPNPNDGSKGRRDFNAVGWHSEKTLRHLSEQRPVLVCAETMGKVRRFDPTETLHVERIWKKSTPLSFFPLFFHILKYTNVKSILVQFEFNVFGGIIPNLALLGMLFLLRLTGKRITFELHQVILDIKQLEKHINITNPLTQKFFDLSLRGFYFLLGQIVDHVVVLEHELKLRLQKYVAAEKIHVLSLAIDKKETISLAKAKGAIGLKKDEFVLFVFGFINGYKGIEWILPLMSQITDKNIRLIIAGGENPYLKDKPFYRKFYKSIMDEAAKYEKVLVTGFIPDEEVSLYFSTADLVVMPYTVFLSASGPFSLTLSHNKPIILSDVLLDYKNSPDFTEAMKASQLTQQDLFFPLHSYTHILSMIYRAKTDPQYLKRLTTFSTHLADLRSSTRVVRTFSTILFPNATPLSRLSLKNWTSTLVSK